MREFSQPKTDASDTSDLQFDVAARYIEVSGGFGFEVRIRIESTGRVYRFFGEPTPRISGTKTDADGLELEFGDGCFSAKAAVVGPGEPWEVQRRYGEELLEAVAPGEEVSAVLSLCGVRHEGMDLDTPSLDVEIARIELAVPSQQEPLLRVLSARVP